MPSPWNVSFAPPVLDELELEVVVEEENVVFVVVELAQLVEVVELIELVELFELFELSELLELEDDKDAVAVEEDVVSVEAMGDGVGAV